MDKTSCGYPGCSPSQTLSAGPAGVRRIGLVTAHPPVTKPISSLSQRMKSSTASSRSL